MTTSEAVRSELVKALEADLIGPFLPEGHPGAGEEVLPLPPSRWYLTGFLAPQSARTPNPDQDSNALQGRRPMTRIRRGWPAARRALDALGVTDSASDPPGCRPPAHYLILFKLWWIGHSTGARGTSLELR